MVNTNKIPFIISILLIGLMISTDFHSQSFKDKMKDKMKKDNSEIYECGYVYEMSLKEKMNPMRALQKGLGNAFTDGSNSDLGKTAISIFYQAHLHPQSIMRYVTKTPGWETCGDAVFAGFTNKSGIGLSSTDGNFTVDGVSVENAGVGTYFHGFSPDQRGEKKVVITSTNGNKAEVTVYPAAPLTILSVDGKSKGEEIIFDGTKDILIELQGGDADPKSNLHVQLICKLMGTPVIYDLIVTKAKNSIYIPKEAFKNFEGSPSPFAKENTLIINRVTEKVIENTDAGAVRTISAYMDWWPISMGGDVAKGSIVTAGFDESKNTVIDVNITTEGEYSFMIDKGGPFSSPAVKLMDRVAIASFVIRGNLEGEDVQITTTAGGDWIITTTTTTTKWFPELSPATWQKFADKMYAELSDKLTKEMGWEILPAEEITNSEAYKHIKPVPGELNKQFVELGAQGTERILTTSSVDMWKDLSITFGSDFISQRLVKELDVNVVLAITIDLNFDFDSRALDPSMSIVAFAPDVSYKTSAKYFSMSAETKAKSFEEIEVYVGDGIEDMMYNMIKADEFNQGFVDAMKALSKKEDENPIYEKLWQAKF